MGESGTAALAAKLSVLATHLKLDEPDTEAGCDFMWNSRAGKTSLATSSCDECVVGS